MARAAVFVDSSAWVALLYRRDQAHARAVRSWKGLRAAGRYLVTTNLVLAETHGFLLRRLSVAGALAFLEHQRVFGPGLVWADPDLTDAAVERWLRRFRDQAFSLTDAVSFEVMRREGIRESFTFDRHYQIAGFEMLSPSTPTS